MGGSRRGEAARDLGESRPVHPRSEQTADSGEGGRGGSFRDETPVAFRVCRGCGAAVWLIAYDLLAQSLRDSHVRGGIGS